MYSNVIFAAPALLSLVAAVPMVKRDVVWVTETDASVVTVPITTTVWVEPSATHYGHHIRPSKSTITSHVHSTVTVVASSVETSSSAESSYVAPSSSETPTTSTSVYVAPTTSTSVYVAPTTSTSVYVAPTISTSVYVAPTTSSVWVAPTTSTSVYVAPTPSSTYVAPTTSSSAAPAASSSASSSGTTYSGDITHYDVALGSCGWTNTDDEAVVAIPHVLMNNPANPNLNPWCGQYITISYAGKTNQAKIVDTCGGCDADAIDLSPTLFTAVAPTGNGRVHDVEWWFTN
ncbi:hypothetical protein LTR08_006768 [Meristemomyces frigidus]|nr:hypothetical protein LTR08_006768 [Meristemomyces frigidus]